MDSEDMEMTGDSTNRNILPDNLVPRGLRSEDPNQVTEMIENTRIVNYREDHPERYE